MPVFKRRRFDGRLLESNSENQIQLTKSLLSHHHNPPSPAARKAGYASGTRRSSVSDERELADAQLRAAVRHQHHLPGLAAVGARAAGGRAWRRRGGVDGHAPARQLAHRGLRGRPSARAGRTEVDAARTGQRRPFLLRCCSRRGARPRGAVVARGGAGARTQRRGGGGGGGEHRHRRAAGRGVP